ncbi:ABR129Cp [Eremothecium gossypii ATCC 10895]|uniref:ABR129Cp n=1 Tax=Eremothecium gossypii (strain ATCC 10895 / CBS 109.51 / FGSC 9923 / NRRL Y-1056) TaxID=284811 RepID=Q75D95_EREGS|nr:ABR129Cp [Eremothecium gossypii ATCC 10895]AAS50900.2 ABR129Cp [Eremothecium gossypii ATCC 10895]AEY95189.1 FABR129Cp [Eremothecium gossypii FDAG1]
MLSNKEIRIVSLLVLDTVFFLLEIIIGYTVHSLALIADSFHMLNDIVSLIVALWAVNVAKTRNPDARYTYGWKRAEILGALINAVFLIALCVSILIEAIQRFFEPQEVKNPQLILYVGTAGLLSNILGLFLFHEHGHSHSHGTTGEDMEAHSSSHSHSHHIGSHLHEDEPEAIQEFLPAAVVERYMSSSDENTPLVKDHDHKHSAHGADHRSLNMHGVFLHVLGDALGNVGVMLTAIFIWKTDYSWRYYSDPFVSLVITCIIFSSALPLSRKASRILLQATPSSISADEIKGKILAIPGVISVHDFHIWNLTETFSIASIHVQVDCGQDSYIGTAKVIRSIFHRYGIHSATVQPEFIGSRDVSDDSYRRFSRIAGGGLGSSTSVNEESDSTKDQVPHAYGATNSQTGCLVDDAANCNSDNCLP